MRATRTTISHMNTHEKVGARIREARQAKKLSGRAAAALAELSESRLRQIEKGWQHSRGGGLEPAHTTPETLVQIAHALDIDADELLALAGLERPTTRAESPQPKLAGNAMLSAGDFTEREQALLRMFFDWAKETGRQEAQSGASSIERTNDD